VNAVELQNSCAGTMYVQMVTLLVLCLLLPPHKLRGMEARSNRIIANWIFLGVGMLIIQVVLGGITRLTGSGLSITEWKPIMGALPPMSETAWQEAFDKYQTIAQYKYLNAHFTLSDFKFIFFWEWFHRLWARLIGVAFAIPFVYFLAKKWIQAWMVRPLIILFVLGGLQGAIGWIMVKSGLNDEDLYVSHIRLAVHFIAAMVLISYALVFGLMLVVKKQDKVVDTSLYKLTLGIIALLVLQLLYGAFMAGLKAASAASTWPDINGSYLPRIGNIFHDRIAIHFVHRTLAYVLFVLIAIWWVKARKHTASTAFNKTKHWPFMLVWVQVALGIAAVLTSTQIVLGNFGVFEWVAQWHQVVGMLLLLALMAAAYILSGSLKKAAV
jgi:cytochrome c oxidase assembly protein subunit 15